MPSKVLILVGLSLFLTCVHAQDISKNNAAANLELIELLGGLEDSDDNNANDLNALDDAMQAAETEKQMHNKPTKSTQDKTHPVGGEK